MRSKAVATLVLSLCATGCWSAAAWALPSLAVSLGFSNRSDWARSYADDGSRAYVSGTSGSTSDRWNGFLTCLNAGGDHLWTLWLDGSFWVWDLAPANAGVVALIDNPPVVVRFDQDGNVVWKKWFHAPNLPVYGLLHSIKRAPDGGYVLGGFWADRNLKMADTGWLVKITSDGALEWSKTYPLSCEPGVSAYGFGTVELSADGGYLAAGPTWSFNRPVGARVIKTDPNGNLLWERKIVAKNGYEWGSPVPAPDGGCFYAGYRYRPYGYSGLFVVRLDSSGELVWARSLDARLWTENHTLEFALSHGRLGVPASDGGIVLAASIRRTATHSFDPSLLKIDSAGNIAWWKSYSIDGSHGLVSSAHLTKQGGVVWCGTKLFDADILLLRCNASGDLGGACPSWAGQVSLSDLKVKVKPVSAQAQDQPVPFLDVEFERHRLKMPTRILCRSEDAM